MAREHISVDLGDHLREFAERKVSDGSYGSTDEVIEAGLRLLEDAENRLEALRAALIEGQESGPPEPFDFDAFLATMHQRHLRRSA